MSISHTIVRSYKDQGSGTIVLQETPSANTELNLDDVAPIAANHQFHWSCTRANLKSLCINSSGDVTVYTNNPSGSSPTDTIPVTGGQAMIWTLATDGIGKCPFTADVTTVYVTNAGGSTANFKIRALAAQ